MLDQIAEGLLAPLDVIEENDQRPFLRGPSKVLRKAHAISSAEVDARPPREGADRGGGTLRGHLIELLQHLDDRP